MKIEIGESLMLSWLRHAKNCQIVQSNWKPSSQWERYNENVIEGIMRETDRYFNEKHGLNLFKKSSFSQLIQQGEIDALGLELGKHGVKNIYAIDVAFHESGLNYGSKEETLSRVIKKLIRSAMILHGYFNMTSGEVIFASPKINGIVSVPLQKYIDELNVLFVKLKFSFRFSLICNDEFQDKIMNVVMDLSKSVADTSELFIRSVQMYNMFTADSPRITEPRQPRANIVRSDASNSGEVKIGALVRSSFERLTANDLLDERELARLTQYEYSKKTFNINLPALKEYDRTIPIVDQRNDSRGRARYYAEPYLIRGKQYLLCNHWVEDLSRSYFTAWLNRVEDRSKGI